LTRTLLFPTFMLLVALFITLVISSLFKPSKKMKPALPFLALLLIPLLVQAQFEQKITITLSGGVFSTFGDATYMPDYGSSAEDEEPRQLSNYKPGVHADIGIQYNLSRHFSIQADAGFMYAGEWFYDIYDGVNYTYFAIWDDVTDELLAEGHNELTLTNIGVGLTPKYYLLPGKRVNPFLFGGINLNFTSSTYTDNAWQAYHDLDMLDPDDSGPDRANIESNTGLGLYPGVGLEFNVNDQFGFVLKTGLYFVFLNEGQFYVPEQKENLNAFSIQAGLRFSFVKSKEL
jgi:opacity protein-like surface antigen